AQRRALAALLLGDRLRLHVRRDLADAAADRVPRPPGLRAHGAALRAAGLERGRKRADSAHRVDRGGATPGLAARAARRSAARLRPRHAERHRDVRAESTPIRISLAVAILAPIGLLLGVALPLGLGTASLRHAGLTPWFWGLNGAASVLASVV